MAVIPAVLARTAAVTDAAVFTAVSGAFRPAAADAEELRFALDAGIPARIPLSGDLVLVLSVSTGGIRRHLAADPAARIVSAGGDGEPSDPALVRDPDAPAARLTLVEASTLGDSVPVVIGRPVVLAVAGRAAVSVTVSGLTVTNGSLRSPGRYGSSIRFAWRDVRRAPAVGPDAATGDPSIPVRASRVVSDPLSRRSRVLFADPVDGASLDGALVFFGDQRVAAGARIPDRVRRGWPR